MPERYVSPSARDFRAPDVTRADSERMDPTLEGQSLGATEFCAIKAAYTRRSDSPSTAKQCDKALARAVLNELLSGITRQEYADYDYDQLRRTMSGIENGQDARWSAEECVAAQELISDIAHSIRGRVSNASVSLEGKTSLEKALHSYAGGSDYGAVHSVRHGQRVQLGADDARALSVTLGRLEGFAAEAIEDGIPSSLEIALDAIKIRYRHHIVQRDSGAEPTVDNPHRETISLEDWGETFWKTPEALAKAGRELSRIKYDLERIQVAAKGSRGGEQIAQKAEALLQLVAKAEQLRQY